MKNMLIYLFGIVSGYFISNIVSQHNSDLPGTELHARQADNSAENITCITATISPDTSGSHREKTADTSCAGDSCIEGSLIGSSFTGGNTGFDTSHLLSQLANNSDIDFSSDAFQTLSFLVKKDAKLALQIEAAIKNSRSYDEKRKLLNILANHHSQETIHFAIEMIANQSDIQAQKLGLEFVDMMALDPLPATLNQALIDATYHQDTDILEQAITQLSHQTDRSLQPLVQERLQALLPDSNHQIKAAVIDGLAGISAPYQIQETARVYLFDADEMVRNAAISSLFKLNPEEIDSDVMDQLQQMKDDSATTASTRRLAAAVLEAM